MCENSYLTQNDGTVMLAEVAEAYPIKHIVAAEEVAQVVTFLCSPLSIAINGDTIAAGGGVPRAISS